MAGRTWRTALPDASPALEEWASPRALRALHDEAGEATEIIECDYLVAGMHVRLRFAGSAMLDRIAPAIAHLAVGRPASCELQVNVWDSASTRTAAPPFPDVEQSFDEERPRYQVATDGVRASYQPGNGLLSVLDRSAGEAWYWVADAATLPFLDTAEPMRLILHWWLGDHGVQMLHGGAVGVPEGGVLITGSNGSGKSTATLASLASRLRYAGDDYVAVTEGVPPHVHSLYNSGKLERHHLERFRGFLANLPAQDEIPDDKGVMYVDDLYPGRSIATFPLRAILVPRVTARREARLVPFSPGSALRALAPTTLLQHHPPQPNALQAMATLVRAVPTLSLELGSDLESIPRAILGHLEGAA